MKKLYQLIVGVIMFSLIVAPTFQSAFAFQNSSGFFRVQGKYIIDPDGNPAILRGIGLGGWLVPEGYMLHIPGFASPTLIHKMIEDLIGSDYTDEFYKYYKKNYVAEKDIQQIAKWGFNSVRLPFHYKQFYDPLKAIFREEGFTLLNTFLDWCRANGLYVIMDMHAAPGGQNTADHSDSDGKEARLWTEPQNQDLTIRIWKEIARRYANESWIIGYDLINEPVLPSRHGNDELRRFYERLADEIREVDPNHILFIEGNWYATDFTHLTPPFDNSMVYSFHKYWGKTSLDTIQYLLDIREQHNVPLWLGEMGENANPWLYEVSQLMEKNGIGWNFWPYKKVKTITSPLSAPFSKGYQEVLDYWNGKAKKPSKKAAITALFGLAGNLTIDKCISRPDVINVLFDHDFGLKSKPFKALTVPGIINAVDYDIGTNGISYVDKDYKNETGKPEGSSYWNKGEQYRNDGVDIEKSQDPEGFKYNVGWIDSGEWIKYTLNVLTARNYDIDIRIASVSDQGRLSVLLDDQPLVNNLSIPNTGGWQHWTSVNIRSVCLPSRIHNRIHKLKLYFPKGGFNINRLQFKARNQLVDLTGRCSGAADAAR